MELEKLLIQVSAISKKYEDAAKLTGENFNIFDVLKLSTKEVRTHSAFIAELLKPDGSHGQGDIFLRLFIEELKKDFIEDFKDFNFSTSTAEVEPEKFIGYISDDETEGGNIDIIAVDQNRNGIIIENKIYADDQKNQLLRYHNYGENGRNGRKEVTKFKLLYLTLDGKKPSISSTGGSGKIEYTAISYKKYIKEWLCKCKEKAVNHPILRETITQYINLIKKLTGQAMNNEMENEIKQLIINNPDSIEAIIQSFQVWQQIISDTRESFTNKFNEMFKKIIYSENDLEIKADWIDDGGGVNIFYAAFKNGENISSTEVAKKYLDIFEGIYSRVKSCQAHICWYNPKPFQDRLKFDDLDKNEIIRMNKNDSYLENFVIKIIDEEKEIRKRFLERI